MNLIELKDILDKDNFTTKYFEPSKELPFDRLNIILPTDTDDNLVLETLFTQGIDQIMEGFRLYQYFVRLPFDIPQDKIEDMKTLILKMNIGLPMIGFGLNEEDSYLYFKSISLVPNKDDVSKDLIDVLIENIYLISFIFTRFYKMIKDCSSGKLSLEKALKKLV